MSADATPLLPDAELSTLLAVNAAELRASEARKSRKRRTGAAMADVAAWATTARVRGGSSAASARTTRAGEAAHLHTSWAATRDRPPAAVAFEDFAATRVRAVVDGRGWRLSDALVKAWLSDDAAARCAEGAVLRGQGHGAAGGGPAVLPRSLRRHGLQRPPVSALILDDAAPALPGRTLLACLLPRCQGAALRTLSLRGCRDVGDAFVAALLHASAPPLPGLAHLDLSGCVRISEPTLRALLGALPARLRVLALDDLPAVSDDALDALCARRRALRVPAPEDECGLRLSLAGCAHVSSAAVLALLTSLRLRDLDVSRVPDLVGAAFFSPLQPRCAAADVAPLASNAAAALDSAERRARARMRRQHTGPLATALPPPGGMWAPQGEGECAAPRSPQQLDSPLVGAPLVQVSASGVALACPLVAVRLRGTAMDDAGVSFLANAATSLQVLDLRDCSRVGAAALRSLSERRAPLRELLLDGCGRVDDAALACLAPQGPTAAPAATLRRLSLRACAAVTDQGLAALARRCHRLRTLDLAGCAAVSDPGVAAIAAANPDLRDLSLAAAFAVPGVRPARGPRVGARAHAFHGVPAVTSAALAALADACPSLTALRIDGCRGVDDRGVAAVLARCPRLATLSAARVPALSDSTLAAAAAAPALAHIDLSACGGLTDAGVARLAAAAGPRLRVCRLGGSHRVTGAAVRALAAHCPSLRELCLRGDMRLDGHNDVTQGDADALVAACPRLERLLLPAGALLRWDAEALRAALPCTDPRFCPTPPHAAPPLASAVALARPPVERAAAHRYLAWLARRHAAAARAQAQVRVHLFRASVQTDAIRWNRRVQHAAAVELQRASRGWRGRRLAAERRRQRAERRAMADEERSRRAFDAWERRMQEIAREGMHGEESAAQRGRDFLRRARARFVLRIWLRRAAALHSDRRRRNAVRTTHAREAAAADLQRCVKRGLLSGFPPPPPGFVSVASRASRQLSAVAQR